MIDELDTFNAAATLALARVARFPGLFSPSLASDVALFAQLPSEDWRAEEAAAKGLFGLPWMSGYRGQQIIFNLYAAFWRRFPIAVEAVENRVTVNAPYGAVKDSLRVVTDDRVGAIQTLPVDWALPGIDDVMLFSEDGWPEEEQRRLADKLTAGSTVTLVRPGERCRSWFELCRVHHDFSIFLEYLKKRVELESLYHSAPSAPVMLTVFGVKAKKL